MLLVSNQIKSNISRIDTSLENPKDHNMPQIVKSLRYVLFASYIGKVIT